MILSIHPILSFFSGIGQRAATIFQHDYLLDAEFSYPIQRPP